MNTVIKRMTHGSLFSGIGGFDLAAEWAGWENKFHCEWNEFGQRVLKYYWPNATRYELIKAGCKVEDIRQAVHSGMISFGRTLNDYYFVENGNKSV